MLASGATKEVYLDLIPQFEQSSGNKAMTTWSGSEYVHKRLQEAKKQLSDEIAGLRSEVEILRAHTVKVPHE